MQNKTLNTLNRISQAALIALLALVVNVSVGHAQFSKAVVLLKGTVISAETGKPVSVQVSVRPAGDTAQEIAASRSNSETGSYVVILKPGKKYWIHLEGSSILSKDTLFETPNAATSLQVAHDFTVVGREVDMSSAVGTSAVQPLIKKVND